MNKDVFNLMLNGVGGEGVLTTGVILTKAAHEEGHFIRGVQLHGLAQRGGSIPTFVRFGSKEKIHSPGIMKSDADLIMALEPIEAVRAVEYASKNKTSFLINNYPYMPIYGNLQDVPYPSMKKIKKKVKPFAKDIKILEADKVAEKEFGEIIYGNTIMVGAAIGSGKLPLKKETVKKVLKSSVPRGVEKNLKAFEIGLKMGKQ